MSRIANDPINIPSGVEVEINSNGISVKGSKSSLSMPIDIGVEVNKADNIITFSPKGDSKTADAMAGTTRALVSNMVIGVSEGFQKKLELVGVGYRAQLQKNKLNLSLGFSHPIEFILPDGVEA